MVSWRVVVIGFALLAVAGCGHAQGEGWDAAEGRLCSSAGCYRIGLLGPDWRLLRREGGEIAFFNESLAAVIQGNVTCRDDADAAPLRSLTEHLLVGYSERRTLSEELVPLARREALHTIVDAKIDGVPITLDLYVLKRNGCIFDFSYGARPDRHALGRLDFERFVIGFVDERRS